MIYLDNSATGGFKPSTVLDACESVIKYLNANPGRSGHRLSITGAKILYDTRAQVANFFNLKDSSQVIFTKNCTEALNMAIFGILKNGDHVITTVYEHNSVLRPLYYLQEKGVITLDVVEPDSNKTFLPIIRSKVNSATRLVILSGASNVNGQITDYNSVGNFLKSKSILFMVDGAQLGGHKKIDMQNDAIDILCLASHKGLYSVCGGGLLLFNEKVKIEPLTFGGTGTETFNHSQPLCYPERLESGTLNLGYVASLYEGIQYVSKNIYNFSKLLLSRTEFLINELSTQPNIQVYSTPNPCGIVAFSKANYSSNEVSDILNKNYDIAVRGGFHCAPLMHKYLNTQINGLIRVSIAPQNSAKELKTLLCALKEF